MVTAPPLTPTGRAILDAIQASIDLHGYPPTMREIAAATGIASVSTVSEHLDRLQADGYLRRQPGSPRAITLAEGATDA